MEEYSVQSIDKDNWFTTANDTFPYGLFLYYLGEGFYDKEGQPSYVNTTAITHSSSVVSARVTPFLDDTDFRLYKIPYDVERFKYKEDGSQFDVSNLSPDVYRIIQLVGNTIERPGMKTKELGTFKCYSPTKNIGGPRSWKNESKLYNYPYRTAYLTDGMDVPHEIKYHLCKTNENKVKVRLSLSMSMDHTYVIENYKNDFDGFLEGFVSAANMELPTTTSQYFNYIAANKNQMKANRTNEVISGGISGAMKGAGAGMLLGSALGIPGMAIGAIGGILGSQIGVLLSDQTSSTLATEKDMRNMPNLMTNQGGDFIHGYNTSGKALKLVRYIQREETMQKIGDYFALYGYKQNKIMKPNLNSRYYYNYIKTIGANIKGNGIPKAHLEELKQIFNTGTTIWHITNSGVNVGDYSKDNREV